MKLNAAAATAVGSDRSHSHRYVFIWYTPQMAHMNIANFFQLLLRR